MKKVLFGNCIHDVLDERVDSFLIAQSGGVMFWVAKSVCQEVA
jgi:hypothetical protein